jgi:hypothetical protein
MPGLGMNTEVYKAISYAKYCVHRSEFMQVSGIQISKKYPFETIPGLEKWFTITGKTKTKQTAG